MKKHLWTRRKYRIALTLSVISIGLMGGMENSDGFGLGYLSVAIMFLVLFIILSIPPNER